ncbi:DNA ligase 1 [Hondaea fermentalgiana]|uniref:DNA ligase n=1 Tax=Hondaea fermentalgiana TaxID=2315210 RepID=A0A2R5GIH6_9STRA|nr:DNA ligase 1 [Hondaea fermentalgiana]|eukprot:GBG30696.1 DNA ligase 1 [Hondaea fermentalgiana]
MNGAGDAHVVPGTWCLVDYFRSLAAVRGDILQLVPRTAAARAAFEETRAARTLSADAEPARRSRGKDTKAWKDAVDDGGGLEALPFVRFLSHFHGDHINLGLASITADLLVRVMGVNPSLVQAHPFDIEVEFDGFSVTFIDANHAPGSAMLLVRRHADQELFLHCGDMRYAPRMQDFPALQNVRNKLDTIFLDSTYANPKHVFPTQQESIAKAASEAKAFVEADRDANTLVMVSAYTIGKERIVFGIAEAIGAKGVYASERKRTVMSCLKLPPARADLLTDDRTAQVHMCRMGAAGDVWPYFQPNFNAVQAYIDKIRVETGFRFDRVIAFIPTGWAESSNWNKLNRSRVNDEGNFVVNLIPYSEHSNFPELTEFVGFLKPRRISPTVFSNPEHRRKIVHLFPCEMCGTLNPITTAHAAKKQREGQTADRKSRKTQSPPQKKKAKPPNTSKGTLFGFNFAGNKGSTKTSTVTSNTEAKEDDTSMHESAVALQGKATKPANVKVSPDSSSRPPETDKAEPSRALGKVESSLSSSTSSATLRKSGGPDSDASKLSTQVEASVPDLTLSEDSFTPSGPRQGSIPFGVLVEALRLTSETTKRLKKHTVLVNAFRCGLWASQDTETLVKMLSLAMGRIANEYEGIELSVGGSIVSDAVRKATGTTSAEMSKLYKETGDLGDVAFMCKTSQRTLFGRKPTPLTVTTVFDTLHKISKESGAGSKKRRTDWVLKLLRQCVGEETRFLVRMLIRNLRVGASEASILDAFAEASLRDRSEEVSAEALGRSRTAFNCAPDMSRFVSGLVRGGIRGLEEACTMTPGIPVRPMLANVCHGVEEFMDAFEGRGAFTCEYKYDGQRIQVHADSQGELRIYSRHCRDCTSGFPEVAGIMRDAQKEKNGKSFILDAEVVAVDRSSDTPKILPFQTLSTRTRKNEQGVEIDAKVSVCVFAFDLIAYDGEPLLQETLRKRRAKLADVFDSLPGRFGLVSSQDFDPVGAENRDREVEAMTTLMQQALHASCEGLMAKLLDDPGATYQPNYRSSVWLKLKQDYILDQGVSDQLVGGGLADTLDLVPIGAWHGNGRKAKWWSPFLLACWDPEEEVFRAVCKVMSGFTDAFYESQNEFYAGSGVPLGTNVEHDDDGDEEHEDGDGDGVEARTLMQKPIDFDAEHRPSAWFRACQVWEIRGAELTLSENATAARGLVPDGNGDVHPRGLSVRFPRFIRVREDKRPEDATTPAQLVDMFLKQTRR